MRLDTTLRSDFAFRADGASPGLLAGINADDGDRAFAPGLVSARTDITTELTAQRGNLGLDISADGWYDPVYFQPSANHSPATFNPISVSNKSFPAATRDLMGATAELGQAFVSDRFTWAGLAMSFRLGRQTLLWGESLFFAGNGIAAGQAPIDAIKSLAQPLAQARELYLPVTQLSTTIELAPGLSLQAYDQFEWRRDRLPAADSYFSTTDILDQGGETIRFPYGYRLTRAADDTPHGIGQFGIALQSRTGDLDLGLYGLQYDAKLPVPAYDFAAGQYHLVFPRHIQMLGASFGSYVGDSNIAGEVSLRHNTPLLAANASFLGGGATGGGGLYAATYIAPPPPPPPGPAYATGDSWHAQTSIVTQLSPSRWWHAASVQAEIAVSDRIGITAGNAAALPGRTHFAASARAVFTPQYFQLLRGLDVSLPIGIGYTPIGRSSLDAGTYEGSGDATISATATYRQVWQAAIAFTHFIGGPAVQPLADRDLVSVSFARSF